MAKLTGGGRYVKGVTVGKGTFGVVFKAFDTHTGKVVAIKKIHLGDCKEGVNVTALREIKLLRELHHPNVVELVDVYPHKRNINLVFEFMNTNLEDIIKDASLPLSPAHVKAYMRMTLEGLAFCHSHWVVHRDMKPNNLLISAAGELKIGDFGLARIFGSPDRKMTNQVFARWYRAPELLFGSRSYGAAVDVWAAGCVFAELLLRRPFLPGSTDIDQLGKIFAALGTPTAEQWPDMDCLPDFVEFVFCPAPPLASLFPSSVGADALDLLQRMLAFDPNRRISAQQALQHRYFLLGPPATRPADLPLPRPLPNAGPVEGIPEAVRERFKEQLREGEEEAAARGGEQQAKARRLMDGRRDRGPAAEAAAEKGPQESRPDAGSLKRKLTWED